MFTLATKRSYRLIMGKCCLGERGSSYDLNFLNLQVLMTNIQSWMYLNLDRVVLIVLELLAHERKKFPHSFTKEK